MRFTVRLLILAAALFLAIGGPLPVWMERIIPALSPLSLFAQSLAQRTWFSALFWSLPPLALLILAVFKGRLFCQWICPLGTLYALPKKISLKKRILTVRLNALLFWTILSASLFGLSSLLWLDPLSTFSRIGSWHETAAWIPGLLIPSGLLLSLFQPQLWCTHLCPLGYSFDLLSRKSGAQTVRRDRRQFLAGLGLGGAAAAVVPTIGSLLHRRAQNFPDIGKSVLPPGARDDFADICTRCYACVSACPVHIVKVKKGGPLNELAMPELVFKEYGCEESCNRCAEVCPTGAIRSISHDEKWRTQIGIARVKKGKCLAWADKEYCMVCDEYCPYNAIETAWIGDVACPVINEALCRGCGACEGACPAIRAGKAIFVHPVSPQKKITESA
jgi:ferredoxin